MFEFSQLRCFVAVAEELHFGRAATRLSMTQPPLSRQVQLLEHNLRTQLFERTSRTVKLTPAGRSFLPEARRLLNLAESAAFSARRVASGDAGTLTLGFTAASGYSYLPSLISSMRSRLPGVDLVLKELVTAAQVEALMSKQLDVGLVRVPVNHRDFVSRCVLREPLIAAIPRTHPLASQPFATLRDFEHQPFIMYSPYEAQYLHNLVLSLFGRAGVAPRYVQNMSQIHSILALVRAEMGMALVPEAAAALNFDGVVFKAVEMEPARPVELFLAWSRANDNPVLGAFLETVFAASGAEPEARSGTAGATRSAPRAV
ncbi:LysR substrate-binding domain-containing protein [Archangium violaceum]|uniref:LysR substrate-binding domain-containing protein n=1 Tax=Archangium violaceum TaxID=83451 RepID=UPI001EEFE9C1|nr:LysR substrate-binding domain-containing protein [Archangium violaceum]